MESTQRRKTSLFYNLESGTARWLLPSHSSRIVEAFPLPWPPRQADAIASLRSGGQIRAFVYTVRERDTIGDGNLNREDQAVGTASAPDGSGYRIVVPAMTQFLGAFLIDERRARILYLHDGAVHGTEMDVARREVIREVNAEHRRPGHALGVDASPFVQLNLAKRSSGSGYPNEKIRGARLSSPPPVVLFDLDGTLIDTYHLYLESYRRALEPHLGRAPTDAEIIARRPSSERRFLTEWIGEEQANECHATMREHYSALHGALGEGPYPGVPEMLTALRSAGYRLGIVTGKGRSTWEVSRSLLYRGEWEVVITDDDVHTPKPDPEGIVLALRQMGAEPGDAVYVGDSVGDLDAGRRAGTRVAAALWPKTAPDERERFLNEIASFAPEWLWEQPADLTRSLARWC